MRAVGPRFILAVCALFMVFLLARSHTAIARSAVTGVRWAVGSDVPSAATWHGWFHALGLPGTSAPATKGGTVARGPGLPSIDWPMAGAVTTPFGAAKDPTTGATVDHTMIAIVAPAGTPVHVAAAGVVLSEVSTGAGEMVKIGDGPYTFIYKGVGDVKVKTGAAVSKGQLLGVLYHQGPGNTSQLGFEVEAGTVPINPGSLVPKGAGP